MSLRTPIALALLAAVAAAGCSLGPDTDYPEKRHYAFDADREADRAGPLAGSVLKVRGFTISRRYEGPEIVHREGEVDWVSDFYNAFFAPPAGLVTERARSWMKEAGAFARVVPTSSYVDATHVLEGHVAALYGDYRDEMRAVMEIQFLLLDDRPDSAGLVLSKAYRKEIPVADRSAPALVKGWNRALAEILAALEQDIAGSLR
jgi:cholesterol transport system auxiliary component